MRRKVVEAKHVRLRISIFITLAALSFICQGSNVLISKELVKPGYSKSLSSEIAKDAIQYIENEGLPPKSNEEYVERKADLLNFVASSQALMDSTKIFKKIESVLATLDDGGHSFIIRSNSSYASAVQKVNSFSWDENVKVARSDSRSVLYIRLPQIVEVTDSARTNYLQAFFSKAQMTNGFNESCGLVIDLSEQKGGNVWPPLEILRDLFGPMNSAKFVDRDGRRSSVLDSNYLYDRSVTDQANFRLEHFRNDAIAVITGPKTASAGEMIEILLLGEGERVRTFGWPTVGLTTSNMSHQLPDGSILILSEKRYALGDGPVIRGGIVPIDTAHTDETMDEVVARAIEWASSNSAACKK